MTFGQPRTASSRSTCRIKAVPNPAAALRGDGERVDPAPVPVVAAHHRADEGAVEQGDEEQVTLDGQLVPDDRRRVVVGCGIGEDAVPEGDDVGLIRFVERTDVHQYSRWRIPAGSTLTASQHPSPSSTAISTVRARQTAATASTVPVRRIHYRNSVPTHTALEKRSWRPETASIRARRRSWRSSSPSNRDADLDAVNRAWNAAGNPGTLSESLFGKIRSELGLTGKRGTNGGAPRRPPVRRRRARPSRRRRGAGGRRRRRRPRRSPTAGRATRGRASRPSSRRCSGGSPRPT